MTSIITNSSALVALSTLKSISKDLDTTNSRISTGLKVNTAKDNAAYWSIATTTKSDNGQLGAVKDALALGAETVNTQTTGMNAVIDKLNELQKKLTTALSANVDRGKIQSEIDTILTDLSDSASAATQAGENWLSVDSSEGDYNPVAKLVASFTRTGGQISLGTVDVDVDSVKLYDKTTSAGTAATGVDLATNATAVSAADLGTAYSSALASFKTAYSTFAAAASTAGFAASTIASTFGDSVNADQLVKFAASAKADYDAALTKYELGAKSTDDRAALDAAEALYTASKALFSAGQDGLNNAAIVKNDGVNGEAPKRYAGMGLKDLCDEMFAHMRATRIDRRQALAFSTLPEPRMPPRRASARLMAGKAELLPIDALADRVAGVGVIPYPPGIPIIMPGESFGAADGPWLSYLRALESWGRAFPGFAKELEGSVVEDGNYRVWCLS